MKDHQQYGNYDLRGAVLRDIKYSEWPLLLCLEWISSAQQRWFAHVQIGLCLIIEGCYPVWELVGYFLVWYKWAPWTYKKKTKNIYWMTPAPLFKSHGVLESFLGLRDFISLIYKNGNNISNLSHIVVKINEVTCMYMFCKLLRTLHVYELTVLPFPNSPSIIHFSMPCPEERKLQKSDHVFQTTWFYLY